jgi:hypothetical protein
LPFLTQGLAPAAAIVREEVRSFYWWEGAVQDDAEERLQFDTQADIAQVVEVVGAAHNYDVRACSGSNEPDHVPILIILKPCRRSQSYRAQSSSFHLWYATARAQWRNA